jgi:Curli production assembly/transport component CsgG
MKKYLYIILTLVLSQMHSPERNRESGSHQDIISKSTKAKIGKIKGVQYLVAWTVSAFEGDTINTGGGFGIKGFTIGGISAKACMAVDLKVIDATTGGIIDARTVEGTSSSGRLSFGRIHRRFFRWPFAVWKNPYRKGHQGLHNRDFRVRGMLYDQGERWWLYAEYAAKETQRREKTKSSIELE